MRKLCILSLGSLQVLHSITWNYLFIVLGIISTVVKMFTTPLLPHHVSQILPIHISDISIYGQGGRKYCLGTWGTRVVWLPFIWQMCVELNTFVPGCRDVSKTDSPHTSGTSQFGWPTSKWLLPRGDGRVSSGGCILSQETGSKWNKPVKIERQSPTSVVEVGMGVPHFPGDRPSYLLYWDESRVGFG